MRGRRLSLVDAMPPRSTTTKRPSRTNRSAGKPEAAFDWHWLLQREIWGLALAAIGIVTLIALAAHGQGKLSDIWSLALRRAFGVGAYGVTLLVISGGVLLVLWNSLRKHIIVRWQTIVGSEVAFIGFLGLIHILSNESALTLAHTGRRGGYIGWALWQLLVPALGKPISVLLLVITILGGLHLAISVPWSLVLWRIAWVWAQLGVRLRAAILKGRRPLRPRSSPRRQPIVSTATSARIAPDHLPTTGASSNATRTAPATSSLASSQSPISRAALPRPIQVNPARKPPAPPTKSTLANASDRAEAATDLPPLDLLTPIEMQQGDEADARMKAEIIENTLNDFGIPGHVTEWSRGPVVTQFGIEPGYIEHQDRDGTMRRFKIRVSKILALTNDLALALAAAPIRIEAPVPGRGIVGIEVPNATKAVVGLRAVLDSPEFKKSKGRLRYALGQDVSGQAVVADLAAMPHLLLAGATGSGKSVCLNAIIASLLFFCSPAELQMILVDPKRVELTKYNGIPHLVAPVVVDIEKVIVALRWVTREMDRRYQALAQLGARDIITYNKKAKSKGIDILPYIVVVIDELADLMMAAPDDVERTICRLAQMARATGIHLVIATQRPSVDVVTGLIKANFPARISFAVTSQVDSRVILDVPGAEKLLGRGDMLFMAPDSPKLQRIQGCYVSDKELDALAAFWRAKVEVKGPTQAPPWEGISLDRDADDGLIQQAIELVRQHQQASASFLQRHLRIGYPRAARLVDQLQEMGVIGPPEGGGRSRAVLGELDNASDERAPSTPDNEAT